ncbi:MAG: ribbon-helix-helix protein, CopG family [Candidatus Sumerlaeaceae bacterium]
MKIKTSITLSEDLLKHIDQRARRAKRNRSDFIENAVSDYIDRLTCEERDARELEILNRCADRMNAEMVDILDYQIPL